MGAFHEGRVTDVGTSGPFQTPPTPAQTPFPENEEVGLFLASFNAIMASLLARQTDENATQLSRDAASSDMAALLNRVEGLRNELKAAVPSSTRIA